MRINIKKTTPKCIIADFAKTKTSEEMLKTCKEKRYMIFKNSNTNNDTNLSNKKSKPEYNRMIPSKCRKKLIANPRSYIK